MRTWMATVMFGPRDGVLVSGLVVVLALDAALVLALPTLLGYPRGGIFLIEALPVFASVLVVASALAVPLLVLGREHVGALMSVLFVLALAGLGAANAYVWVLCVSSV